MKILAPTLALLVLLLVSGARAGDEEPPPPRGLTHEILDADRDGVLTLGEWVELFATADRDGDRRLSAAEWKALLDPPSRPGGVAPAAGSAAPAVKAVPLAGGDPIDLARPRRTTVLVFGSWT